MHLAHPVSSAVTALLLGGASLPLAAQTQSATMTGSVIDAMTDAALAGVDVFLENEPFATATDQSGGFVLTGLSVGPHVLVVRAVGYTSRAFRFTMSENHLGDINLGRLALEPRVTELEEIRVEGREGGGRMEGFYRRQARGFGNFITREQIAQGLPRQSTDVFRRVPGVNVHCRGSDCQIGLTRQQRPPGQSVIGQGAVDAERMVDGQAVIGRNQSTAVSDAQAFMSGISGSTALFCPVQLFVDGVPYESSRGVNEIAPDIIEGIEIYKGPATTPARFARPGASCGVIAIWTRRPGAPQR